MVQWILQGQSIGDPKSRFDIKNAAWLLSEGCEECAKFGPKGPSEGFVQSFLKRHRSLTTRKPEALSSASANVTQQNLISWFQHIYEYFEQNGLLEILKDPSRVCNCDEAGFLVNPMGNLVVAEKSSRDVHKVLKSEKEQITALYGFSADGFSYDPYIVYPGKRLSTDVKSNIPPGINYTMTESGWMNTTAFGQYLKVFAAQARARDVKFPIALFLDGHKSHEGIEVAKIARDENIVLIRLYPNATSYYQPADKGIFKPVKGLYEKFLRFNQVFEGLTPQKKNFAKILRRIHKEIDPEWVKTSFNVCGLYPFNENAIDYTRLKTSVDMNLPDVHTFTDCSENNDSLLNVSPITHPFENSDSMDPLTDLSLEIVESLNTRTIVLNPSESIDLPDLSVESENVSSLDNALFIDNSSTVEPTTPDSACDTTPPSGFSRMREFYSVESPFLWFCQTIGQEKVIKYENPNFMIELENEKLLFMTYHQLKQNDEERMSPLTLPKHKKPAKRGRIATQKLNFVTTSDEYVTAVQQKNDIKADNEAKKLDRKILREQNRNKKKQIADEKKQKRLKAKDKEN